MVRAQDGDRAAYTRLLKEIAPYLRVLAARRLNSPPAIEDAVQDVLLSIHTLRHTYDPRRPFGPWLVAIARRRIIDRYRRDNRRSGRETPLTPAHETFEPAGTNVNEEAADHRLLLEAVNSLPVSQRQAIRLLKLEELSLKEASAVSGLSVATLKVATHRALKRLKQIFGNRGE